MQDHIGWLISQARDRGEPLQAFLTPISQTDDPSLKPGRVMLVSTNSMGVMVRYYGFTDFGEIAAPGDDLHVVPWHSIRQLVVRDPYKKPLSREDRLDRLRTRVMEWDAKLDDAANNGKNARAPTGDDYNIILGLVMEA